MSRVKRTKRLRRLLVVLLLVSIGAGIYWAKLTPEEPPAKRHRAPHRPNPPPRLPQPPLYEAARSGDVKTVEALLNSSVETKTIEEAALREACQWDHVAVVAALLDHGVDANAPNEHGRTPLHCAASGNSVGATALLIAHGADINAMAGDWSPLSMATGASTFDVGHLLLSAGAEVNPAEVCELTPLHLAAGSNRYAKEDGAGMAQALIACGANVHAQSNTGLTALHLASRDGRLAVARVLLANRANVNTTDRQGRTPLNLAEERGYVDVAELLRLHGGRSGHVAPRSAHAVADMPISNTALPEVRTVAVAYALERTCEGIPLPQSTDSCCDTVVRYSDEGSDSLDPWSAYAPDRLKPLPQEDLILLAEAGIHPVPGNEGRPTAPIPPSLGVVVRDPEFFNPQWAGIQVRYGPRHKKSQWHVLLLERAGGRWNIRSAPTLAEARQVDRVTLQNRALEEFLRRSHTIGEGASLYLHMTVDPNDPREGDPTRRQLRAIGKRFGVTAHPYSEWRWGATVVRVGYPLLLTPDTGTVGVIWGDGGHGGAYRYLFHLRGGTWELTAARRTRGL